MSKEPEAEPAVISQKRVIIAPQSAGRIGKSTAAEAITAWLQFAGVDNVLLDLDAEHLTLSSRFPDSATAWPEALKSEDGWARFMAALTTVDVPAIVCDLPAQSTEFVLRQLTERRGLDLLEESGIRLTVLLFPAEDTAARQSAIECVRALGERADWIVVWQPGPKPLAEESEWAASRLGARLRELRAMELRLPRLTRLTLEEVAKAVRRENRWLPLSEAIGKVGAVARHELELWRNQALTGCGDAAEYLVSDPALVRSQTVRIAAPPAYQPSTGPVFDL